MSHVFFGPLLAGEPLPSDLNSEFWAMVLRITLFLGFLLVFVFVCGWAWRTLPGLKAILPEPPQKRLNYKEQITLAEPLLELEETDETQPLITRLTKDNPPDYPDYHTTLEAALADGRPGSVVQAASEPGSQVQPPIIILHRADEPS